MRRVDSLLIKQRFNQEDEAERELRLGILHLRSVNPSPKARARVLETLYQAFPILPDKNLVKKGARKSILLFSTVVSCLSLYEMWLDWPVHVPAPHSYALSSVTGGQMSDTSCYKLAYSMMHHKSLISKSVKMSTGSIMSINALPISIKNSKLSLIIKDNSEALRWIHRALDAPHSTTLNDRLTQHTSLFKKSLIQDAKLLSLQAFYAQQNNDINGSARNSFDLLDMGIHLQSSRSLLISSIGNEIGRLVRNEGFDDQITFASKQQAIKLLKRLITLNSTQKQIDTLIKIYEQDSLDKAEKMLAGNIHLFPVRFIKMTLHAPVNTSELLSLYTHSKYQILLSVINFNRANVDYLDSLEGDDTSRYSLNSGKYPLISRNMLTSYTHLISNLVSRRADDNGLILQLALHIYHIEHGHYPKSLNQLISDHILDRIPVNPYLARQKQAFFLHLNRANPHIISSGKVLGELINPLYQYYSNGTSYVIWCPELTGATNVPSSNSNIFGFKIPKSVLQSLAGAAYSSEVSK